jgi:[protein-PII] uridylyltransferase
VSAPARASLASIRGRRAIIDRRALKAAFAALGEADRAEPDRMAVLALLRETLEHGRAEIRERFEQGGFTGHECVLAQAVLMDEVLRALADFVSTYIYPAPNPTTADHLCIAAVGGYGRAELAPFSDIDLLFLLPYKKTSRLESLVEYVLYLLWDLGLKVGHATRTTEDCIRQAQADITIRTAMLEVRFIWGQRALFNDLKRRYERAFFAGSPMDFVDAKLAERDTRHSRYGESRYLLEPNIKEGKGGLRDLQTLFWLGRYVYHFEDLEEAVEAGLMSRREAANFLKAENFLWTVRCWLHYVSERAEERLTVDLQPIIARACGYRDHAGTLGVERFMKHYYLHARDVGTLTRIFCARIEEQFRRRPLLERLSLTGRSRAFEGFQVSNDRLLVEDTKAFKADPANMLRLFKVAGEHRLDIHPDTFRLVTRNLRLIDRDLRDDPEANALFLDMLLAKKDAEVTLRRLNDAGVLGRFLPDFGKVVGLMQHNMYHSYTVDEHTIISIGILHRIENGALVDDHPLASEVIHKVLNRRVLYVALLLHDIAKGRGGDHSVLGEKIAQRICPRLGLTEEETETVAWLVRWHLAMSGVAFQRDLQDAKTIRDFADLVQSVERLRLLLCLTVADIRAVGPNVWNGWKATLLRELYYATESVITGGIFAERREARVRHAKRAIAAELADLSREELETFFDLAGPGYWLAFDAPTHARHCRLLHRAEAEQAPLTVDIRVDAERDITEVTVHTLDMPGLVSRISGAIAVCGGSIVDAKIFTLTNSMALDVFWIQDADGGPFEGADKHERLRKVIGETLAGKVLPRYVLAEKKSRLPSRTEVFKVAPRVLIDNNASNSHTVIEVNGRDRPGFIYRVTRALTDAALRISSAQITTYGERAVDVFYVKDVFGLKITNDSKLDGIRDKVLAAIEEGEAAARGEPVKKPKAAARPAEPEGKPERAAAKPKRAAKPANKPVRAKAKKKAAAPKRKTTAPKAPAATKAASKSGAAKTGASKTGATRSVAKSRTRKTGER